MSGRKSIIKTMLITVMVGVAFLIMGGFAYSSARMEQMAVAGDDGFIKTQAYVEDVKKVESTSYQSNRKTVRTRTDATVSLEYEGETYSNILMGVLFVEKGDMIDVYFNPETKEMKSTITDIEGVLVVLEYIPAFVLMGIGGIVIIFGVVLGFSKLSVFSEKNMVMGVIADVEENSNITIDHKHPKVAICDFNEPGTNKNLRVRSGISTLDLFGMVGMNVPIYYNRKNPAKSFVDLENATGEMTLGEGQQKVHDLRNL